MQELDELRGRYHTIRPLGEGPRGKVLLVEHRGLGRLLALKIYALRLLPGAIVAQPPGDGAAQSGLPLDRLDPRRTFAPLMRAVGRIDHPSIGAVFDFGLLKGGQPYVASEYAAGDALSKMLRGEPLPAPRVARIGRETALGLAELHAKGLCHGAVAPTNLGMFRRRGRPPTVKLLDAAAALIAPKLLRPEYRAPELDEQNPASPAGDLFALGAVLYQLLTTVLPFGGGVPAAGAVADPPSRLAGPDAPVPFGLDALIVGLCNPDPNLRPAASRVAEELEAFAIGDEATVLGTAAAPAKGVMTQMASQGGPTLMLTRASTPAQAEERFGRLVRSLAESIADQGGAGAELAMAAARVADCDERILSLETEIAVVDSRAEEDEERFSVKEARLRRALIDLCSERARLFLGLPLREPTESGRRGVSAEKLDTEQRALEKALAELGEERTRSAQKLDHELASHRQEVEHEREALAAELERLARLVLDLRSVYGEGPLRSAFNELERVNYSRPRRL